MKANNDDCRGLTRRQLLGLATLTSAGLAAASVGVPEAKAAPKPGEQHEPLITIFGAHGRTKTEAFGPGEVAFIKQGFGHFVEQIGDEPTKVLILLKSPGYEEINISTWLAANPLGIISDNFGISRELADKLPRTSIVIAAPQVGSSSST